MKILFSYIMLLLGVFTIQSCGDDNENPIGNEEGEKINWNETAEKSSKTLVTFFWNTSGKYFNSNSSGKQDFLYWPQAHALDVLIDIYQRTEDKDYKNYFDQWFEGVYVKNGNTFWNEYYDDMEWIALALLRTYKATGDQKYKEATLKIWEYIKVGWNDNAGGGITWKKGMEYSKNACSNGPACILAARLFQEFGDEKNKEWALKIYNWEKFTLFNNGIVYDHINNQTGEIQKNWIFTYNQGTFIGSAVELYKIFNEKNYLNDAILAADYATSNLTINAILKDEGTGDGGLFKGIFIRYLTELIQQDHLDAMVKKRYLQFMKYNAETLWKSGTTGPAYFYGPDWRTAPGGSTGLTEQLSGCMLIEAVALLESKELL